MTRNITHQNEPIAQAGGIGAGFLLVAGTILASGLALFGAASWLGVQAEIQRGLLRGVLTAAAGCAIWVVLLRAGRQKTTRNFLGAVLGGVLLRLLVYAAVVGVSAWQASVHMNALIFTLVGFHLVYQTVEVVAMSRWSRTPPAAMATGMVAVAVTVILAGVPAAVSAAPITQDPPRASDSADVHGHGDGERDSDDHGDGAEAGDGHGGGGAAEFDLIHHVADGQELETPFGAVHLPAEWIVGGVNMAPTKHVVWMWIATALLLVFVFTARRGIGLVSRGLGNALEALVVFVRDEIARKNIGTAPDRFTPYLCSLFFFILACNLVGLLPFGATASGNLNFTGALAVLSLVMIQAAGIRQNGLIHHIKGLCPIPDGVPGWLLPIYIPIIVVVETVGIFVKPVALALRLFANMVAGHVVILSLIGLIFILETALVAPASVALALFIYCLEVFIGFVQAFIFTMLTALFVGLSQHPAH